MKSKVVDRGKIVGGLHVTKYAAGRGQRGAIGHRVADLQDDVTLCGLAMGRGAAERIEGGWGILRDREPGETVCAGCDRIAAAGRK